MRLAPLGASRHGNAGTGERGNAEVQTAGHDPSGGSWNPLTLTLSLQGEGKKVDASAASRHGNAGAWKRGKRGRVVQNGDS